MERNSGVEIKTKQGEKNPDVPECASPASFFPGDPGGLSTGVRSLRGQAEEALHRIIHKTRAQEWYRAVIVKQHKMFSGTPGACFVGSLPVRKREKLKEEAKAGKTTHNSHCSAEQQDRNRRKQGYDRVFL